MTHFQLLASPLVGGILALAGVWLYLILSPTAPEPVTVKEDCHAE